MVRRWQVHPDMQIETQRYGLIPVVSRQLLDQAFLDGAAMVAAAGGGFTSFPHRHPTDLEHEMVTTSLMCEWRDRTDAKPQPEPATAAREEIDLSEKIGELEPDAAFDLSPPREEHGPPADDNPDGLDPATLEEEDLDSVPEIAR